MQSTPLIIERIIDAPPSRVWQAITDKNDMKQWYFDLADFDAQVGFSFEFVAGKNDKKYRHFCTITEVVPGKKLVYSWQYEGEPGISYVSFELFPEGNSTRLLLTHTGLETFISGNPDLLPGNFEQGWNHIIGSSLIDFLKRS